MGSSFWGDYHKVVRMRSRNVQTDPDVFLITGFATVTKTATTAVTRPTAGAKLVLPTSLTVMVTVKSASDSLGSVTAKKIAAAEMTKKTAASQQPKSHRA